MPSLDSAPTRVTPDSGHLLSISFTCGHGNAETFGKDRNIFI